MQRIESHKNLKLSDSVQNKQQRLLVLTSKVITHCSLQIHLKY